MNMSSKYIAVFVLMFAVMLGWNVFLIDRDAKLFKAYDTCKQFTHHPDCVK